MTEPQDPTDPLTQAHPPTPSLDEVELVAARGAVAERVTLTQLKNNIARTLYLVVGECRNFDLPETDPLGRMTLCFVTTWSGFTVVGKSAPMSVENFDRHKGEIFAYEDALKQLWPLMAFSQLQIKRMLGLTARRHE